MQDRRSGSDLTGFSVATALPSEDIGPSRIASLQYWIDRFGAGRMGIALMVSSCGVLTVGDAAAKWLTETYPVGQVICLRGLIIIGLLLLLYRGAAARQLWPRNLPSQALRAVGFVASTFLMIWSFKLLPLATVSAIAFAAPLVMTALAPLLLGEQIGVRRWTATIVGFLGVLVIISPRGGAFDWVMMLPVGAAVCGALRDLATRYIAGSETAASVVFFSILATTAAGAFTIPFGWAMPTAFDWLLFLALGCVHGTAYLMQVLAFRAAEAGLLAPFKYTLLLWAILAGFLVWGHVPSLSMLAGASIVIASGIYIWRREASLKKRPA